jgi:tRNA uridine 5-carboxymethylaminomethyl modification enzyme
MIDVLVIGGGHAGVEAAGAAARRGAETVLLTFSRANLGTLSCNPSVGGLGKGHIVREVDAFDGIMARAADASAIHHRMLNSSKGAAVRGPRVQADRRLYATAVRDAVAAQPRLTVVEGEAIELIVVGGRCSGAVLNDGAIIEARTVVLATGTFLGARMFRGEERLTGGRIGEAAALPIARQLRALDLPMGRLKTGTPPRLDGRTIDWAMLAPQPSDVEPWSMSAMTRRRALPQVACALTRTTPATHDVIRANLHRSPMFSGAIEAGGPRYCPSIEDKVARFGDREGHQLFLEPEGLDDAVVYPNGISTSLPVDAQAALIATIPGLERARITMAGYAVEYDFLDPRCLDARLALSAIDGVFCAGQVNGTTGYEEAAGQGLVAGLNAAAEALGSAPVVLDRASSYIGVMIDDLVLQGVTEPYRMLTARAEFRLALRADNAETRLGEIAAHAGCLGAERLAHQTERQQARAAARQELDVELSASAVAGVSQDGSRRSIFEWLRFEGVTPGDILPESIGPSDVLAELIEDARYAPYIERQAQEVAQLRAGEAEPLPDDLDYRSLPGLSNEMVERLVAARPGSLAAASRVRGVTPAALSAIFLHAKRQVA